MRHSASKDQIWTRHQSRDGPDDDEDDLSACNGAMETKWLTDGVPTFYGDGGEGQYWDVSC